MTLHASDNGSTQTVHIGDIIVIELDTAGGSGYTWTTTAPPDTTVLTATGSTQAKKPGTQTTSANGPPLVGTPEVVTTAFRAVGAGTTKVVLGHVPPGGGAPSETFTVTVVVAR